jgi:hypothetical protein
MADYGVAAAYYLDEWIFLKRVVDIDGRHDFKVDTKRQVARHGGRSVWESVSFTVDRQYFEDHLTSGFEFKIYGDRGYRILKIPAYYVQGFLQKVDEVQKE